MWLWAAHTFVGEYYKPQERHHVVHASALFCRVLPTSTPIKGVYRFGAAESDASRHNIIYGGVVAVNKEGTPLWNIAQSYD